MVGLHPHIPYKESLETMKRFLDKRKGQSMLLDSLLKHNVYYNKMNTFHPALYIILDILKSSYRIKENSLTLKDILPNATTRSLP